MKTPAQTVLDALTANAPGFPLAESRARAISEKIKGWSTPSHYYFFQTVLAALPVTRILILGVYQGRDIAFMSDGCNRELAITGVDKFADSPCDDWPKEKLGQKWAETGFGEAPTKARAEENLRTAVAQVPQHKIALLELEDVTALSNFQLEQQTFDLIYLDTAHDRATVVRQLRQIAPLCTPETLIAGDDYENLQPTWGVKDAVSAMFIEHHLLGDSIWFADRAQLKVLIP